MSRGTVKVGSAGRFATRYGVKTRTQIAQIEAKQKALHQCPRCGQVRVKRLGTSIWKCRRCKCVFAGGAYMPRAAPKQSLGGEKVEAAAAGKKARDAKDAKKAPRKKAPRAEDAPKAEKAPKAKEAPDQPEKPASPAGETGAPKKLKKKPKEEA
jgi:large subunit ribosomal protein L37Ae